MEAAEVEPAALPTDKDVRGRVGRVSKTAFSPLT